MKSAQATSGRTRQPAARPRAYVLRIELADLTPTIWRRVWVDDSMLLAELHHVIQAAFGWTDAHLHEFRVADRVYATPDAEDPVFEREVIDERLVALRTLLKRGVRFEYLYDFGDDWLHRIEVERTVARAEPLGVAYVEAGERACPPEDCGGPGAYQRWLDALASDPESREVAEFLTWAGADFDPARFDRFAANVALFRMACNGWGKG